MIILIFEKIKVLWFLFMYGDVCYLGMFEGGWFVNLFYLCQIVQVVDELGYFGVLLFMGCSCEDSWVVVVVLVLQMQKLCFLVVVWLGL